MKRNSASKFFAGMLFGAVLFGGGTAYAAGVIASPSTHHVTVDDVPVSVAAYTIGGSNYFKLRDIAAHVDFGVIWNSDTRTVEIRTDENYVEDAELPSAQETTPDTDNSNFYSERKEIVDLTNAFRAEHGLPALTMDDDLMAAAQVRAEEAAANLAYRHTRPDGSSFKTVLQYDGLMHAGENLGMKDESLAGIPERLAEIQVEAWAASEGHKENIMQPDYSSIGTGIAQDKYGMYYLVQLFAGGNYNLTGVDDPILP